MAGAIVVTEFSQFKQRQLVKLFLPYHQIV